MDRRARRDEGRRRGLRVARRAAPLLLCALLALGGCRATGRAASGAYAWTSATFTPNPASVVPYLGGFGVGFVATLPLCIISWPLTVALYPDDEEQYYSSAALAPAIEGGALVGSLLGAVFYPAGIPFLPGEPAPSE